MFGGQLHTELVGDETEPVCFAIASDEDPKEVKKFFGDSLDGLDDNSTSANASATIS